MGQPTVLPAGVKFPNVFVFPRNRIVDPKKNVLLVANLFNFKVNGVQLRPDHDLFLGAVVAPLLTARSAAGARLVGLASPTGTEEFNLRLSLRRAKSAETSLSLFLIGDLLNPPGPPPRISVGAQGEHFADALGVKHGTEEGRFRAVLVTVLADRTVPTFVRLLRADGSGPGQPV